MNDSDIKSIADKAIAYIHSNISAECLPLFKKYYSDTDLRLETVDFIRDRYEALIDSIDKYSNSVYNQYLLKNSVREVFLKVLYVQVSLKLLVHAAKVSMDVSFNDFKFICEHKQFSDVRDVVDSIVFNTTTYFADLFMYDLFAKRTSFVIDMFKDDYAAALKLLRVKKKKARKMFLNKEFINRYGIDLKTANDIFVNLSNDVQLYGLLTSIFEKRKENIEKLPKNIIEAAKVTSKYCTKEWIDEMVELERKKLMEMAKKFPSYTESKIEEELEKYRTYLKLKCSRYAEFVE